MEEPVGAADQLGHEKIVGKLEWFARNPDAQFEAEEIIVSRDRAVVRWVYRRLRNGQPWHLRGVDNFHCAGRKSRSEAGVCERLRGGDSLAGAESQSNFLIDDGLPAH
jgi:hypothetical protein